MQSANSRRKTAKRRQITDAARKLFLAQGVAGTSMDAVAAEAGVSKQTLYSYFPTKVQLLESIILAELSRHEVRDPEPEQITTMDALRSALLEFAFNTTRKLMHPDSIALIRLTLGEAFLVAELRDILRQAVPARVLEQTETLLRRAADQGLIAVRRPDLSARMLVGPIMTFVAVDGFIRSDAAVPPSREDLAFVVDSFLRTVAIDE